MIAADQSFAADWAKVGVITLAALVAFALLIFEMRQARLERRRREEAEAANVRDRALDHARRVVAWIGPIRWEINRQGVVVVVPGGWKLVISN